MELAQDTLVVKSTNENFLKELYIKCHTERRCTKEEGLNIIKKWKEKELKHIMILNRDEDQEPIFSKIIGVTDESLLLEEGSEDMIISIDFFPSKVYIKNLIKGGTL